ncbi:MAG: alpha-L-fucosidase [Marinilabiliales bacterium]|nr:alpha-L-fucosidase [Marinilabiliales bacterium]
MFPETNPLVIEKLEQWQSLKFGLLMHWGTYSQWGYCRVVVDLPRRVWMV